MKSLQNQYNDIKKGKGSKDIFLKEAKRLYPNIIPNHTNFRDSVKLLVSKNILTNKNMLNEHLLGGGIVSRSAFAKEPDWFKTFNNSLNEWGEDSGGQDMTWGMHNRKESSKDKGNQDFIKKGYEDYLNDVPFEACPYEKGPNQYYGGADLSELWKQGWENAKGEYEASLDREKINNDDKNFKRRWGSDQLFETSKRINEAKKKKEGYDYENKDNIDNIYGTQFLQGFYLEMSQPENEEKTVDEVKKIVAKNLKSDPLFYVKNGQFGVKGVGYVASLLSKSDQMEPVSKEKIKANVKNNLSKKEAATSKPKGIKTMPETSQNFSGIKKMKDSGKEKVVRLKKKAKLNEWMYDPEGDDGDRDFDSRMGYEADDLYDEGLELFKKGDKIKAEELRQQALKKGSWLGWGDAEFPSYDSLKENDTIKKAIDIGKNMPDPVEELGFHKMGDDYHYFYGYYDRIPSEVEQQLEAAGFYVKEEFEKDDDDTGLGYYYDIALKDDFINEIEKLAKSLNENDDI